VQHYQTVRGYDSFSPLLHVNLALLAGQVREAARDTLDGRDGVHDLLLAIDVGVQHTQNVLESVSCNEGLQDADTRV
jgi:hypothetical protein